MNRYNILLGKRLSEQDLVVYDIKKFRSECLRHAGQAGLWNFGFKEVRIRFLEEPRLYQHWVSEQQGEFVFPPGWVRQFRSQINPAFDHAIIDEAHHPWQERSNR